MALGLTIVLAACSSDATEPAPPGPPPPAPPQPEEIDVVSGDDQVGTAGLPLTLPLVVRISRLEGDALIGVGSAVVTWDAVPPGAALEPATSITDADGSASVSWTLAPVAGAQTARATVASGASTLSIDFKATAFVDLTIVSELPEIHRGEPVEVALIAAGGAGPPYSWSVAAGTLPAGLELSADGNLTGTPIDTGAYAFQLAVTDAAESSAARVFETQVCDPPLDLPVGETVLIPLPVDSRCSLVLPGVSGRTYEIGLMGRQPVARDVAGQLRLVTRVPGTGSVIAPRSRVSDVESFTSTSGARSDLLREGHVRHLAKQAELLSRIRPPTVAGGSQLARASSPPPTEIQFYKALEGGTLATATLRAASAEFAYYEEAGTAEGGFRASDGAIQAILDFYGAHGRPLIESIGGLAPDVGVEIFADASGQPRIVPAGDLDENGRIVIIQLLDTGAGIGAFVSDFCDREPRPEHALPGVQTCSASNEGEYIYLGPLVSLFPEFFPSAVVHEATHLASVGHGMFGQGGFEPIWIEEGIAYLVGEKASRAALGIGEGEELQAERLYAPPQPGINTEGILQILDLATHHLDATPRAGIFGNVPELGFSEFQGGAWLFLRHVLDLYVAGGGSETDLLRSMIAERSGVAGLEAITGRSLADLLAEYVAGLAVETRPLARAASPYRFRSYDLRAVTAGRYIPGSTWPYPEVVGPFAIGEWTIDAFHGGPVYFEFGSGSQSMEIQVTDGAGASVQPGESAILSVSRVE